MISLLAAQAARPSQLLEDTVPLPVERKEEPRPEAARCEVLRHYLRCYGPSTPQGFAEWTTCSSETASGRGHAAVRGGRLGA